MLAQHISCDTQVPPLLGNRQMCRITCTYCPHTSRHMYRPAHSEREPSQRILDRAQARGNNNNTAHAGNRNSLNGGGSEQVDKQDNCRQPQKTSFSMHTAFLEKSGPARI
jgi:hypothetical protein